MRHFYLRISKVLFVAAFIGLVGGCNIINPTEQIPTYVHIDSVHFTGSGTTDINCIWAYYNGNPVGAFDLPATFPVMANGTGMIQVAPGILLNGRNDRPSINPFYTTDTMTLVSQPGKTVNFTPVCRFYDSVKFFTISEFEAGATKFSKCGGTTGIITVTDDSLVFSGSGTGAIYLSSPGDSSIDSTIYAFTLPAGEAFIEFDYNSTIPFAMGVKASIATLTTDVNYLAGIYPSSGKWKKFYLNLTKFLSTYPDGSYVLYIKANLSDGQASGRLLIDNVKLVSF